MGLETPIVPQNGMLWDVRIIDEGYNIVDGAIGIRAPTSGSEWMKDFYVDAPRLYWESPPQAGESEVAIIEVNFARRVKEVRALLIALPERYRHDIPSAGSVVVENEFFPLATDRPWSFYQNLRWVRILVKTPEAEGFDFIPGGTNRFRIPTMVPTTMPANKEWYFALCREDTCEDVDNAEEGYGDVYVAFPLPNVVTPLPPKVFPVGARTQVAGAPGRVLDACVLLVVALLCGTPAPPRC